MYWNTTPKTLFTKGKKTRKGWFTLVEIMIVIVIIVLLTQLGNIGGLFRTRERNKVEEIAVKIIAAIDEEKVNALLGKTLDGKIVRKRLAELDFWSIPNTISFTSVVNLAEIGEATYDADSKITKSWSLAGLEVELYDCPLAATPIEIKKIGLEFRNDTITFVEDPTQDIPNHIVLLLKHTNTAHEIHIDRRTGLTYDRESTTKNTNGSWSVQCN
jgi:prepilin-type N-terminal cleavage/methylation domain-containing protein